MIQVNRATTAALGRCFLVLISMFALEWKLAAEPMVYTGIVVTDVRVGATLMHNASLKITFEGDTNNFVPVAITSQECTGSGYFSFLAQGVARMEIQFQGHTRVAKLADGQVFVALDECSGGIGFGAFIGPNGLEPAYPLGLTLGTAEYASVTYTNPLSGALSTTGAAWSCIGFPPGGAGALNGTPDGQCISPDSYPLASNIGNIYVYQPYYEGTTTGIASGHSGATNRAVFLARPKASGEFEAADSSEGAEGSRVVYTLQTVADGSLGGHVFNQALVTFQMTGNPYGVTSQASPVDATKPLYENRTGYATVTVDDGGRIIKAKFAPGEVYVRYDTGAGVAGFGSRISPTYPVALNCSDSAYPSDSTYTADCLQGDAFSYLTYNSGNYPFRSGILNQLSDPVDPSPGVAALAQSLSQNTILAGTAHTCAGVYTFDFANTTTYFPGDLGVCAAPAPHGLQTSKGALFLQDLEGGTLSLGNAPIVGQESGTDGGWDLANSGFLHVELIVNKD